MRGTRFFAAALTLTVAVGLITWVLQHIFNYPEPVQVDEDPAGGEG